MKPHRLFPFVIQSFLAYPLRTYKPRTLLPPRSESGKNLLQDIQGFQFRELRDMQPVILIQHL